MTVLYPDKCFNEVCFKGTACCINIVTCLKVIFLARHIVVVFGWKL